LSASTALRDYRLAMTTGVLGKWPLLGQIFAGADATSTDAMSERTATLRARTDHASVARSVCPYCAVGCGQLVYHDKGRLLAIEGDPASPINQGTLCPKGAASHQLLTHSARLTRVLHRAPHARGWTALDLETALNMVADRVWESRKRTFVKELDGERVNHTTGLAHLGGATLDNEENYLIKKLFTAGLGMVNVSNQARI
jgi:formate dehydrogenase major subunit